MRAGDLLNKAAYLMTERGKQYDQDDGERSMARTVLAFNAITGQSLTETQGWQFMEVLKAVRNFTGNKLHEDSMLDGIAYAALKAESGMNENLMNAYNGKD